MKKSSNLLILTFTFPLLHLSHAKWSNGNQDDYYQESIDDYSPLPQTRQEIFTRNLQAQIQSYATPQPGAAFAPSQPFTPIMIPPHSYQDASRRSRTSKIKSTIIPVGEICDPTDPSYSKCSPNAECVLFEAENLYRCNCSFAYEVTSSKKCLRSWGQHCDNKETCNHESYLSCIDNRCDCDNSETYQNAGDKCRSKVGGPCSPNTGLDCVANALCLSFDRFGQQSRCICKDGYVETSRGICAPGVGMACSGKDQCNSEIPLVCKEGACSCREAVHVYDPEINSCVGLVGAQCCTNFDGVDCPAGITNGCVAGAFCKKTSRNLPGRCACQSYNLESDDRTCTPNTQI